MLTTKARTRARPHADMLDYAISRKPSSRLTCQVKVTDELVAWVREKGGRVQLARY